MKKNIYLLKKKMTCYYSNDNYMSSFLPMDDEMYKVKQKDINTENDGGENDSSSENDENDTVLVKKNEPIVFDAEFKGNTMIIGATNTGKTTIIVKLVRGGFISNRRIVWITNRELPKTQRDKLARRLGKNGASVSIVKVSGDKNLTSLLQNCKNAAVRFFFFSII